MLEKEISKTQNRLGALNAELARIDNHPTFDASKIRDMASQVVQQLEALLHDWRRKLLDPKKFNPYALRRLAPSLIKEVVVDSKTRDLEIAVNVPLFIDPKDLQMCLLPCRGPKGLHKTHLGFDLALARFLVKYDRANDSYRFVQLPPDDKSGQAA